MLGLEKYIRRLAKSAHYQLLYTASKEMGVPLFRNERQLSGIQLIFTYWLRLYSQLYEDLSIGTEYLDREVIENDLRTDAFLLLRKKEMEKDMKERKKLSVKSKLKGKMEHVEETVYHRRGE